MQNKKAFIFYKFYHFLVKNALVCTKSIIFANYKQITTNYD